LNEIFTESNLKKIFAFYDPSEKGFDKKIFSKFEHDKRKAFLIPMGAAITKNVDEAEKKN